MFTSWDYTQVTVCKCFRCHCEQLSRCYIEYGTKINFWVVVSNVFYFTPKIGEMIQFDEPAYSFGWVAQPPTRIYYIIVCCNEHFSTLSFVILKSIPDVFFFKMFDTPFLGPCWSTFMKVDVWPQMRNPPAMWSMAVMQKTPPTFGSCIICESSTF